jgi:heavy metal translocating P-type ATPase
MASEHDHASPDAGHSEAKAGDSQMRWSLGVASLALAGIVVHLVLRFAFRVGAPWEEAPLLLVLALGGVPLLWDLLGKLWKREFGSDLLAGISIVTATILGQYLAGSIIVLMLSGGESLERFALKNATSALRSLAKRLPSVAHRRCGGKLTDITLEDIEVGDTLILYPHEICPADGVVIEGHGAMDESYLTGEPFRMTKTRGSAVISGAVNGDSLLVVEVTRRPADSRFARIMQVMRKSEQERPRMRRLGDQLGAWYTPLAVGVALAAWLFSGEPMRFLAVLVIATPCPLLIGIPTAIIGSISLCASRAIVIRNPSVLEQAPRCRTAIFDKTGTLTYGNPSLVEQVTTPAFRREEVLRLAASLECYSRHPLAVAILDAARREKLPLLEAHSVSEPPGKGLTGRVGERTVEITGRGRLNPAIRRELGQLPVSTGGLECVVLVDGCLAAVYRFRDAPRAESRSFIQHLGPKHLFDRLVIVSGDRESEARYLGDLVGISEIHAGKSPEEKLAFVRAETARAKTVYVGDGINDAPAMLAATVGVALGQNSDVTADAAGVVILDNSLRKVDEFLHISRRMRNIALQSALGGMVLSILGMSAAAAGWLTPIGGAILQEIIDVLAVLNAMRAAFPPSVISDVE